MLTKRLCLSALAIALLGGYVQAQISEGGMPASRQMTASATARQYLPQVILPLPDINALLKEDSAGAHTGATAFRIGTLVDADISMASGTVTIMDNGDKVWRTQVEIPGAKALGLYYDHFKLPKGVKYFLSNANGKQLLGAYTANNNSDDGHWANEKVQGELVNLEMDIPADVDMKEIQLHINYVCVFYKAVDYLNGYSTANPTARETIIFHYNGSSPCEVNARCPEGDNFPEARKATVHIEFVSGRSAEAATGTMINNTNLDCTPYILTAMHVDASNSTSDATFSSWVFYFNYETPTCNYTGAQPSSSNTITGAKFRSRSTFQSTSQIAGDFLLLELNSKIPTAWGIYLAGWDHSGVTPTQNCITFHHPVGDVKKLAVTDTVSPNGNFGADANSHWELLFGTGGVEEGSSGCGLFDVNGRLIGDLSGGLPSNPNCTTQDSYGLSMGNYGLYSKLSYDWLYTYQSPSSAATRLKDWLDPANTGAMTLNTVSADCSAAVVPAVHPTVDNVVIYPNPANGIVYATIELTHPSDIRLEVYNMLGARLSTKIIPNANSGEYKVDLSNYANGVYMISVTANNTSVTKKIMLIK